MNRLSDIDLTYYRSGVMFLMRVLLAFIFIKAGMGKWPVVEGERLAGVLPLFLVYLVVIFEFAGGLFMLLGMKYDILTKLGAAMIAIVMIGATYMHYVAWGDPFGSKDVMYPIALLLISLIFITDE
tara:strand:+ start:308 stop:685 length:378 start_codon:yes stop_codon:yes gene_type:complete